MDRKTEWRRRLDVVLTNLSGQLKVDLYDNVVVPVVQDWFASLDPISALSGNIQRRLNEAWPLSHRKVEAALFEFEAALKANLRGTEGSDPVAGLQLDEAEHEISTTIASVLGAIVTVIAGSVSGGAGMALIAGGPVGWIIGAVVAAVGFYLGKEKVEHLVESALHDTKIPPMLKRAAKSKVATELTLCSPKFEEQMYNALKEQSAPLYEALDKINELLSRQAIEGARASSPDDPGSIFEQILLGPESRRPGHPCSCTRDAGC